MGYLDFGITCYDMNTTWEVLEQASPKFFFKIKTLENKEESRMMRMRRCIIAVICPTRKGEPERVVFRKTSRSNYYLDGRDQSMCTEIETLKELQRLLGEQEGIKAMEALNFAAKQTKEPK